MSATICPSSFVLRPCPPPSDHAFAIYESVCIAGRSLRAAAAHHHLSVTRIRQLVKRVVDWLASTLPLETDGDRQKQVQLARHIAADQLQYARAELMDLWRQTHNPTYLLKTTRVTLALARLGAIPGTIDGLLAAAQEVVEAEPAKTPDSIPEGITSENHSEFRILNSEFTPPPPPGDCAHAQPLAAAPPTKTQLPVVPNAFPTTELRPSVPAKSDSDSLASAPLRAHAVLPQLTTVLGTMEPQNKRTRFLRNLPCET